MKSIRWSVIALLAVAVAVLPLQGKVARATPVTEVSQPVQVTSDSHYERGQSIVYDGTDYWLFYGRSDAVTGNYDNANPDTHDYRVYFQKASSVPGLASASPTLISGVAHNGDGYLGETGAAYFDGDVWAFATIDVGANAELYGWYTSDEGANWTEVGPIVAGLSDGQAHHDEVAFDGELWVVEGSGSFTTTHSATPKAGPWSAPLTVDPDPAVTGGLAHFFVDGSNLYLAVYSNSKNYVYKYNSGTVAWDKVDEIAPPEKYDPTLFKVGGSYVFAQAPWVSDGTPGGHQYIIAWSSGDLDGTFFDGAHTSVTEGGYGDNSWVDMWPIGFSDAGGDTYLLYTSERDEPTAEGTGNIWYLKWDWDPANDHYTYIQEAVDGAAAGDTVNVAEGTYVESGQMVVDSDVSLVGAGASTTTIKTSTDTGSSGDARGWFLVNDGITLNLSGVTLDGTGRKVYQAIRSHGQGSISDCAFTNIKFEESGPAYAGLAIVAFGGPDMNVDVTNCTFSQIGRVGVLYYGSGITDSTFSGNTYTGKGDGNWLDYALDISAGAQVTVTGNTINGNTGVASSDGSTSAGIMVTTYYGPDTTATITENFVSDSTAGIAVGYDDTDTSTVTAFNNSLTGNEKGVDSTAPLVDASANWWGANTPAGVADQVSDDVDYTPWLNDGTDTEPGTPGFQGSFSTLDVDDDSPQTGASGRVQEAIDLVSGSTVNVAPGTYTGTIDIDGRSGIDVVGADRDTVIIQPASTLSWALPGYPQYDSRQAPVRVVSSTDIDFSNMTFDFDTVKGNFVHGVFYWDSTGVINNNVLKNMSVPEASGGYYEITSYVRAPSYSDGARAAVTISNNEFLETGRLGIVTHDFVEANITGNTFTKTTDDFGYAIELGSRSTGTISGNTISGYDTPAASDGSTAAGIYIENSFTGGLPHVEKPVTVSGNTLTGNQYGLWIGNEYDGFTGDVDISVALNGNDIVDNLDGGVYVVDEDREAGSSVTLTASGNTVSNNGQAGYYFNTFGDGELHATVTDETVSGHDTGIVVEEDAPGASGSLYDIVLGPNNTISNSTVGVSVGAVSGVTVSGNDILGFSRNGVRINGATDAEVSANNVNGQGACNGSYTAGTSPETDTRCYGVEWIDTTGTISGNTVTGVKIGPGTGAQDGVGIRASARAGETTTVTINDNVVSDYQKNGMNITAQYGGTVSAMVDTNTVTGWGPTGVIAQNGVQAGYGADVTIEGNTVSGNSYTGPSWAAANVLVLFADTDVIGNGLTDGQVGLYYVDGTGTIADNTVSATTAGVGRSDYWGIVVSDPPAAAPSPYEDSPEGAPAGAMAPMTVGSGVVTILVDHNTITGDGSPDSVGLEADSGFYGSDDIDLTASYNEISNWGYGVVTYDCPGCYAPSAFLSVGIGPMNNIRDNGVGVGVYNGSSAVAVNFNYIVGNTTVGVESDDAAHTLDATNNWWGACDGPSGVGPGSGDAVSDYVDYDPWLHSGCDFDGDLLTDEAEMTIWFTDWQNPDTDGDGCADGEEALYAEATLGGQRDPLNPWDFYDVPVPTLGDGGTMANRDKAVSILGDILGVLEYVGTTENGPPNGLGRDYDDDVDGNTVKDGVAYDRSVGATWSDAPDGAVTILVDTLLALAQSGHSCQAAP